MKKIAILFSVFVVLSCQERASKAGHLGVVNLKVHGSPTAQTYFERGLLLLHSFEYVDAREAFLKAQTIDPNMGMAYWGEAMTYNHSIWGEQDYDEGVAALKKFKIDANPELLSALELDLIKAVEILYAPRISKIERDQTYKEYMEALYAKYPKNHEVAAFYAISLLGSVPEGRNDSVYGQAAKVAQKILDQNPNHPGALHYLIHSYDDPEHAKLAIDAANAYAVVAPDASHALHMPSHIYVALGMWDKVISSNVKSYEASLKRMQRKGLDNDARGYHAYHWLEYGYLQNNKVKEAKQMVLDMKKYTAQTPSIRSRSHLVYLKGTYLVETNDWKSEIANIDVDISNLNLTVQSQYKFLEAYKAFKNGEFSKLNAAIEELSAHLDTKSLLVSNLNHGFTVCASLTRETPTLTNVKESKVMLLQLKALKSWFKNDFETTEDWLKASVAAQQELSYSYGPPVIQKPSYELYAEWLMTQKRYEEAVTLYDLTLKMAPNRRIARKGKQKALLLTGTTVSKAKKDIAIK